MNDHRSRRATLKLITGSGAVLVCLLAVICVLGCRGHLPDDFKSRSLDEQIALYERWFKDAGRPNLKARSWISCQGLPAARAMAPYVIGKRKEIPRYEALQILWAVQLRGCTLRGTSAEQAVRDYIRTNPSFDLSSHFAPIVLKSIELNDHVDNFDPLPPGPCQTPKTVTLGVNH